MATLRFSGGAEDAWTHGQAIDYAQLIINGAGPAALAPIPQAWWRPYGLFNQIAWANATADAVSQMRKDHLVPALRAYLQARDACPLLAKPQIRIAANRPYLVKADPRTVYIDRAKRVVTNDPELWFLFGMEELVDGHRERAAESWHRSLELSDSYLGTILELGKAALGPQLLADSVLPDNPEILLTAALRLYPDPKQAEQRRPFLERALAALNATVLLKPSDFCLKGRLLAAMAQPIEAAAAYREALQKEPLHADWRYELAQVLVTDKRLMEARSELLVILRQQQGNYQARELLRAVEREQRREKMEGEEK